MSIQMDPDGHEWKRAKWNWFIRRYWKLSEKLMVKYSDLLVCDSKNIENYIKQNYKRYHPKTIFIAYGAETEASKLSDDDLKVKEWYNKVNVKPYEYFLVVGRFVPENNFETMIKEFLSSNSKKDLVLITGIESNKFYKKLKEVTCFDKDKRIEFVGTVYNQELLKKIRENAYAYLHGHEVGGTNPSLLEALSCTKVNLLFNVGFNKEVAEGGAFYWTKELGDLASVIDCTDELDIEIIEELGDKAKKRIKDYYLWNTIMGQYELIWKSN